MSLQDRIQAESVSTANTNSNPDKGQPCLTPRSNLNQLDAYPLLIVRLRVKNSYPILKIITKLKDI